MIIFCRQSGVAKDESSNYNAGKIESYVLHVQTLAKSIEHSYTPGLDIKEAILGRARSSEGFSIQLNSV